MMLVPRYLGLVWRDIVTLSCLHRFLLEFLGTALFLSVSLSAVLMFPTAGRPRLDLRSADIPTNLSHLPADLHPSGHVLACPLQVVLAFGLSIAMAVLCVGGEVHLNPAITMAMALSLRLRLWRAALYVVGQFLGGVASAGLLLGLMGDVTPVLNQVSLTLQ